MVVLSYYSVDNKDSHYYYRYNYCLFFEKNELNPKNYENSKVFDYLLLFVFVSKQQFLVPSFFF